MRRFTSGLLAAFVLVTAAVGSRADALPIAPEPVEPIDGVPAPCRSQHPWPGDDVPLSEIKLQLTEYFGFELTGAQWSDEYRDSIRIVWETLDAVSCTDYLPTLKDKANVGLNATSIRGYAWGDWSLTRSNYVSLDFSKFERALAADDEGRLVRLVIHELAHVWNSDRHANPAYWQDFRQLTRQEGRFSDYAGSKDSEIFADAIGYYVGRCALDNPYDTGEHDAYYQWVKDNVFDGKEFGPAPGETPDCTLPSADAEEPMPGDAETPSWIEALSEG